MSPESQWIAIAEQCGCRNFESVTVGSNAGNRALMGIPPDSQWRKPVPDYINDLNAMHEAEKVLTEDQVYDYQVHLFKLVTRVAGATSDYRAHWSDVGSAFTVHATAAQRAEAFLRTLLLWA